MSDLFGAQYEALFAAVLDAHVAALDESRRRKDRKWCAFWAMVGRKYRPGGVLLVGRSLNGWDDSKCSSQEARSPGGMKRIADRCRRSFCPRNGHPMRWVQRHWQVGKNYRTSRSQFWQMARRLAEHHGYHDQDWPSALAWTNLMRISPACGGNSPNWSYFAQVEPAARLLDYELRTLQPTVAVFLTGSDWYTPFQEKTDLFRLEEVGLEHVHYAGQHGRTRLIVSDHPQTRPRQRMMEQIAQLWPRR